LAPGAVTAIQHVRSSKGYTGSEPRHLILQNSQFVDARVRILAKYASTQWKPIGEYVIERRLIAQ
jgi:hypothetical protein